MHLPDVAGCVFHKAAQRPRRRRGGPRTALAPKCLHSRAPVSASPVGVRNRRGRYRENGARGRGGGPWAGRRMHGPAGGDGGGGASRAGMSTCGGLAATGQEIGAVGLGRGGSAATLARCGAWLRGAARRGWATAHGDDAPRRLPTCGSLVEATEKGTRTCRAAAARVAWTGQKKGRPYGRRGLPPANAMLPRGRGPAARPAAKAGRGEAPQGRKGERISPPRARPRNEGRPYCLHANKAGRGPHCPLRGQPGGSRARRNGGRGGRKPDGRHADVRAPVTRPCTGRRPIPADKGHPARRRRRAALGTAPERRRPAARSGRAGPRACFAAARRAGPYAKSARGRSGSGPAGPPCRPASPGLPARAPAAGLGPPADRGRGAVAGLRRGRPADGQSPGRCGRARGPQSAE